jgi:hypothetical protein
MYLEVAGGSGTGPEAVEPCDILRADSFCEIAIFVVQRKWRFPDTQADLTGSDAPPDGARLRPLPASWGSSRLAVERREGSLGRRLPQGVGEGDVVLS